MAKIGTWMKAGAAALAAAAWMAGCETSTLNDEGTLSLEQLQGLASTNAVVAENANAPSTGDTPATGTTTNSLWHPEITGTVKLLHTDVSSWPETASLHASVSGSGNVSIPYSKANVWPGVDGVNANPWVFVNLGGQWYAATWEYLRVGQTSKSMGGKSWGGHIKVSPLSSWEPSSGERFGLMVSGLVRGGLSNVKERSNVSMVTWP